MGALRGYVRALPSAFGGSALGSAILSGRHRTDGTGAPWRQDRDKWMPSCARVRSTDEELTVSGASAFGRFASLLRCSQELARGLLEAGADRTSKPKNPSETTYGT
jgi:hypothetical protein